MKREPLKIGDRIRVYHRSVFTGKVDTISPDGYIGVIEDGFYSQHDESPFHPKQLRRLKPRKPKGRREWKAGTFSQTNQGITSGNLYVVDHIRPPDFGAILVELNAEEIIVDREKLAKAWDVNKGIPTRKYAPELFEDFCKALGLKESP